MNLHVRKHKRNNGAFFHKCPDIKCSHTKSQACKDITEECGDGKMYSQNYIGIEHLVLKACSCEMTIYSINTITL